MYNNTPSSEKIILSESEICSDQTVFTSKKQL